MPRNQDALLGRKVMYRSILSDLPIKGTILYVYQRGPDGTPASYIVERPGFNRPRPETVKIADIVEVLPKE